MTENLPVDEPARLYDLTRLARKLCRVPVAFLRWAGDAAIGPDYPFCLKRTLHGPDGQEVGYLAVADHRPRELDQDQLESLEMLALQAEALLLLRAREEREALLHMVTDNARLGLVVLSRQHRYLYANESYKQILGLPDEEIVGRRLAEVIPHLYDSIRPRLERAFAGETVAFEIHLGERHFWVRYEPAGPDRLMVVLSDMTESRRADDSEARYRALFDYAPYGIVVADKQSRYLDGNQKILEMLGYSHQDFIGLHAADIAGASEVGHIESALDRIQEADDYAREWRIRRRDGSEFRAEVMAKQMPDGNLLGVIRDISSKKRADEAEERMRFALDSARIGIWDLDIARGELSWSHWLERQHGFEAGTFPGTLQAFIARVHPDDREAVLQAVRTSGDFTVSNRVVWPDGTVRWLRAHGRVFLDAQGNRVRSRGISVDITEQRVLEEQFQQSQKMEAIGRLAGGVAHDFNNLLTIILGFSALLSSELEHDDPRLSYTGEIERAAQSAASLTRQLLAFSRKQIIEPRLIDLNAAVAGLKGMVARLLGEDVEVVLELQDDLWVRADRGQLEQVVINLAVNARDAMPQGGRLCLQTRREGSRAILQVSDTGTGIAEDILDRIFEPFFTTKEFGQGTGLGLASVHGIVSQSGGTVRAGNTPEGGARLVVSLPRVEAPEAEPAESAQEKVRAAPCRVLVVDDAEGVRNYARKLLERNGFEVLVAASGNEAAQVDRPVDVLLTDVVMPSMSGPELAEILCRRWPQLKVAFMSGYTEEAIVERGTLRPGIHFVQKPFEAEELLQKISQLCS